MGIHRVNAWITISILNMTKQDILITLIWLMFAFAMVAFVCGSVNVFSWHWLARAVMLIIWFAGLAKLENLNK